MNSQPTKPTNFEHAKSVNLSFCSSHYGREHKETSSICADQQLSLAVQTVQLCVCSPTKLYIIYCNSVYFNYGLQTQIAKKMCRKMHQNRNIYCYVLGLVLRYRWIFYFQRPIQLNKYLLCLLDFKMFSFSGRKITSKCSVVQ